MTNEQIKELVGIIETALMGAEPTSALSPCDALYKLHDEIDRLCSENATVRAQLNEVAEFQYLMR